MVKIFPSKIGAFDTLKDKFLVLFSGCHSPIMQLSSGTAVVSKEITCGHLT